MVLFVVFSAPDVTLVRSCSLLEKDLVQAADEMLSLAQGAQDCVRELLSGTLHFD